VPDKSIDPHVAQWEDILRSYVSAVRELSNVIKASLQWSWSKREGVTYSSLCYLCQSLPFACMQSSTNGLTHLESHEGSHWTLCSANHNTTTLSIFRVVILSSSVMGQVSSCSGQQQEASHRSKGLKLKSFPDLVTLPPELAVQVLSYLDATDLCLASCVNEGWCSLANVEQLWKG